MSLASSNGARWTDDRVEALAALWRNGLSASQIARRLGGVTRNAVIGKLYRLRLPARVEPATPRPVRVLPTPPPEPRRRLAKPRATAPTPPPAPAPDATGLVFDLVALGPRACRWPIGDPRSAGFSFCGRAAAAGDSYCAYHARRGRRSGSAKPPQDDPWLRRLIASVCA